MCQETGVPALAGMTPSSHQCGGSSLRAPTPDLIRRQRRRLLGVVDDYLREGERVTSWIADGVVKYHRLISTVINALQQGGLRLEHVDEWCATDADIAAHPEWAEERYQPMFLLFAASLDLALAARTKTGHRMALHRAHKPNKPDTTQPFKAAVGATVRAIGGKRDLEVSFSADRPMLTTDKARLANLPRLPTRRDIAIARGQGDAMAMRLASHDPDAHRRRAPAEPDARAAYDALEQARVEALGCVRMPGMAGNIHEMLEDRLFRAELRRGQRQGRCAARRGARADPARARRRRLGAALGQCAGRAVARGDRGRRPAIR